MNIAETINFNQYANANQMLFFDLKIKTETPYIAPFVSSIAKVNEIEFSPFGTEDEVDISKLIIEDVYFNESIRRAREQMKEGVDYLSHEEVFEE